MELREPRFIEGDAMRVAGLSGEYTRETTTEIPGQWERFNRELAGVPAADRADGWTYAVIYAEKVMQYISGVRLREGVAAPQGWVEAPVPAQRYAVFADTGGVPRVRAAWSSIFGEWLPKSGMSQAAGPMLERYPEDYLTSGDFEIWIPVKV